MNQAIASMDKLSVKDRGDVITKVFNKPAFSKIRVFAHRSTNTHTCTLADACAHGDVGCTRTLTESGSILWHHRLV